MMTELFEFLKSIVQTAWSMLDSSSSWVVFSFIVAGLLHEFIKPEQMQKTAIGSKKVTGVLWTTLTGMMLPICSCGTIPLGISMYYSGAYLGPTLTFMTSTPMINPLAVMMCWGLLGPQITIIYVVTGFVAPMLIGMIANKFAGDELHIGLRNKKYGASEVSVKLEMDEEEEAEGPALGGMIQLEFEEPSFWDKIKTGLRWSATELSVTVSKYSITGMLMAGLLFTIIPQSFIHDYLGQPGVISLVGIAVVAALMYVWAVGHIPFIAALVASGAAPGVSIMYLMAGAGTNIPELLTITKMIGKRASAMYFTMVSVCAFIAGYVTNKLLMPGFVPVLDFDRTSNTIEQVNKLMFELPGWGRLICNLIVIGYAFVALYRYLRGKMKKA